RLAPHVHRRVSSTISIITTVIGSFVLLFLPLLPPTRFSSLFPYTTLFRSPFIFKFNCTINRSNKKISTLMCRVIKNTCNLYLKRSEERRVGKECRSRRSPYQ